MQQHTIQIFMWAWYPESAKIHQKVSGGFWRIQDMSNIYTGGFWWIQDTSILCVTKLVDFGGFRILSSKNTQGVRIKPSINTRRQTQPLLFPFWSFHHHTGTSDVSFIFIISLCKMAALAETATAVTLVGELGHLPVKHCTCSVDIFISFHLLISQVGKTNKYNITKSRLQNRNQGSTPVGLHKK